MIHKFSTLLPILLTTTLLVCLKASGETEATHFEWDNRTTPLLNGIVWVSPTAAGVNNGNFLVDGKAAVGWTTANPRWDTNTVSDGQHTLTLASTESVSAGVLVLNDKSVVIHGGTLENDEVWQAGVIHIVRHWVRIPEGKRLVIANDTVVKFCEDTGILNNGTLSALSVTLTALEDDSKGGDTNHDGNASAPADDTYTVVNNGTLTAINCKQFYATKDSVFYTTVIADGAFSGCPEITKATIPADVTGIGANAFNGCKNLQEITFQGTQTPVNNTAFDGCDNLEKVYFPNGLPESNYKFGDANPVIYAHADSLPQTWSGYTVVSYDPHEDPGKYIPYPEEEGEPGQVLTLTEDSVAWMDIPVDSRLDEKSTNAVQNQAVTAALNALQGDIGALEAKDAQLANTDKTLQDAISALQKEVDSLKSKDIELAATDSAMSKSISDLQIANQQLSARLNGLLALLENSGSESQVLTKGAGSAYSWQDSGSGTQVLTIDLEEGWNLVAMPGNVVLDESQASILKDIEIYTYDKTKKVYLPSDGLKPMTSYWMRAPKACTIHFKATK